MLSIWDKENNMYAHNINNEKESYIITITTYYACFVVLFETIFIGVIDAIDAIFTKLQ